MEEVCRVCSNKNSNLVNIFVKQESEEDEEELPSPAEMLDECTNCRINQHDRLPKQICESCLLAAKSAFRLRQRCQQNLQSLCDLADVCCVCRSSSITRMDIFEKRQRQEGIFSLAEMMDECLGTETANSKSVKSRICLSCLLTVRDTFKFKRKYERNNLLLTNNMQAEGLILPDNNIDVNIKLEMEEIHVENEIKEDDDVHTTVGESLSIVDVKKERNVEQEEVFIVWEMDEETKDADESLLTDILIKEETGLTEFDAKRTLIKKKLVCNICGKKCMSKANLRKHKRRHIASNNADSQIKTDVKCLICDQACNPTRHTRSHTGKLGNKHISRHKRDRRFGDIYQCICSKIFPSQKSLTKHVKVANINDVSQRNKNRESMSEGSHSFQMLEN